MAARFGRDNPNYRTGNYCGDFGERPGEYVIQAQLKECLLRLLNMDLTKEEPTPDEKRWVLAVIEQRPLWAIDILSGHGFKPRIRA